MGYRTRLTNKRLNITKKGSDKVILSDPFLLPIELLISGQIVLIHYNQRFLNQ